MDDSDNGANAPAAPNADPAFRWQAKARPIKYYPTRFGRVGVTYGLVCEAKTPCFKAFLGPVPTRSDISLEKIRAVALHQL
jgi:hypothetical protein